MLHSGQEYQQQQSRQSHHGHHNNHQKMSSEVGSGSRHKQPRVGSLSHELLDSSHTPTKFSADNSAISSVVTSPTSSVRSKRMQHHQRPQIPAASVAASMASAAVVPSSSSMQQPQVPIGMTTSYGKKCFRILYFWLGQIRLCLWECNIPNQRPQIPMASSSSSIHRHDEILG